MFVITVCDSLAMSFKSHLNLHLFPQTGQANSVPYSVAMDTGVRDQARTARPLALQENPLSGSQRPSMEPCTHSPRPKAVGSRPVGFLLGKGAR